MIPDKIINKQKITIVGTGNVGNLVAAFLAVKNRELPEEDRVEISILGRDQESPSFKMIKEQGIRLHCKNPEDVGKIIEVFPLEFVKITNNVEDIGEQDHIFVTTKAYSYSVPFFKNLEKLKKKSSEVGSETTITLAQNGIPCWFLSYTRLSDFSLESVDPFNRILDAIGLQNIVGCVLNLACNQQTNEDGLIVYNLLTSVNKIGMPIGSPDNGKKDNVVNLKFMLRNAGIDVATRGVGISEEVLLKLQVNIAVNALTTMFDCTIGHLLDNPPLKKVVDKLALEVNSVAIALGTRTREGARLDERLGLSRNHITSTRSDFNNGNPLEMSLYKAIMEIRGHLSLATTSVETSESVTKILDKLISKRDGGMTPDEARQSIKKDMDGLVTYVDLSYRPPTPLRNQASRSQAAEVLDESPQDLGFEVLDKVPANAITKRRPENDELGGDQKKIVVENLSTKDKPNER